MKGSRRGPLARSRTRELARDSLKQRGNMIPDHVIEFLGDVKQICLASRDARLQPCLARGFGLKVHPDQTTITYYIPELRSEQIIANFENNGRVAVTVGDPLDFEAYQLKGKFVSWCRNDEQDDQFLDKYQAQLFEKLLK